MKTGTKMAVVFLAMISIMFLVAWFVRVLPIEFAGLSFIYLGFVLNFSGATFVVQKEYAWFRKTEFKLKKLIVYDFDDDPHIPLRMIYHQLLSYVYLFVGLVLWVILYALFRADLLIADDPARLVMLISTYYALGIGGLLLLIMMQIRMVNLLRYRGEYFVDSKWIK